MLGVDVRGAACLDVGASTGGFTDCLLQHGAAHVIALDVGYGQLHPRLRDDPRVTVLERMNVRNLPELPYAPELVTCDVSFISLRAALPPALALARAGWRALPLVKPQFEAGRAEAKRGVVRDPAVHARVLRGALRVGARLERSRVRRRRLGSARPKGQSRVLPPPRPRRTAPASRMRSMPGSQLPSAEPVRRAAVVTHGKPEVIGDAVARLETVAAAAGVEIVGGEGADADIVIVLGGDGTMLRALQRYLGSGTAVFGVNFGRVGFLTSMHESELEAGISRVFAGEHEVLELATLDVEVEGERAVAVNDVVVTSATLGRMVELDWRSGRKCSGRVPCDGVICATPTGSTAYNLSNGGPVLVWGLDAMAVTFVAPHSLHARSLVVPRRPGGRRPEPNARRRRRRPGRRPRA